LQSRRHGCIAIFREARFKVTYNGKPVFEVEDSSIADAGVSGLWTKAESVTLFDNLSYDEVR
jgi:hypothetical protein